MTTDRVLSCSGLAVVEGQHVGLRLLDNEIRMGASFLIFVNASAVLR